MFSFFKKEPDLSEYAEEFRFLKSELGNGFVSLGTQEIDGEQIISALITGPYAFELVKSDALAYEEVFIEHEQEIGQGRVVKEGTQLYSFDVLDLVDYIKADNEAKRMKLVFVSKYPHMKFLDLFQYQDGGFGVSFLDKNSGNKNEFTLRELEQAIRD